jgi:CRISPR-associated protein Cas1
MPYAYLEYGRLCVKNSTLQFINDREDVALPIGRINTLFCGPGTTITHSAIKLSTKFNSTIMWVGEDISKCYTVSACQNRSSENLLKQVFLYERKKGVLLKRYCEKRFGKMPNLKNMTEEKIRGYEGSKMKKIYYECALKFGIPYTGRHNSGEWSTQNIYDKSISIINSFLYGICSGVINALGYSTALGILHSGNTLSLVFDIADLYKTEFSIPIAFEVAKLCKNGHIMESEFEKKLREKAFLKFQEDKILTRILADVEELFNADSYNCKKFKITDSDDPVSLPV